MGGFELRILIDFFLFLFKEFLQLFYVGFFWYHEWIFGLGETKKIEAILKKFVFISWTTWTNCREKGWGLRGFEVQSKVEILFPLPHAYHRYVWISLRLIRKLTIIGVTASSFLMPGQFSVETVLFTLQTCFFC